MGAEETAVKKRRKEGGGDETGVSEKAMKWATEFSDLEEDDQYTYLEELAPRMSKMHLQFLQGIIGFDDEDDEDEDEDDFGEEGEEDEEGEEEDEGEEDAYNAYVHFNQMNKEATASNGNLPLAAFDSLLNCAPVISLCARLKVHDQMYTF